MNPHLRKCDVLQRSEVRKEVEGLKYHPGKSPQSGDLRFTRPTIVEINARITYPQTPGIRNLKEIETANQTRFSRTRWPDDRDHLAFGHFQSNVVNGSVVPKLLA